MSYSPLNNFPFRRKSRRSVIPRFNYKLTDSFSSENVHQEIKEAIILSVRATAGSAWDERTVNYGSLADQIEALAESLHLCGGKTKLENLAKEARNNNL